MKRPAAVIIATVAITVAAPVALASPEPPYSAMRQTVRNAVQKILEAHWIKAFKTDYPAVTKNTTAGCVAANNTHMTCVIVQNGTTLATTQVVINPKTSAFKPGPFTFSVAFKKETSHSSANPGYNYLQWLDVSCARYEKQPSWYALSGQSIGTQLGEILPFSTKTLAAAVETKLKALCSSHAGSYQPGAAAMNAVQARYQ